MFHSKPGTALVTLAADTPSETMRCDIVVNTLMKNVCSLSQLCCCGGENSDASRCEMSASLWKNLSCWATSLPCKPARQFSHPEAPWLSAAMRLAVTRQSSDKSSCLEQTSPRLPLRALAWVRTCLLPVDSSEWQSVWLRKLCSGKFPT